MNQNNERYKLNIDCMEYMATQPDEAFDLAIVDPPYGIGMAGGCGNKNKKFHGNDSAAPDVDYFIELKRVSKNQIIWGANHSIDRIPINSPCWIA